MVLFSTGESNMAKQNTCSRLWDKWANGGDEPDSILAFILIDLTEEAYKRGVPSKDIASMLDRTAKAELLRESFMDFLNS
jgi:hypothetical protein